MHPVAADVGVIGVLAAHHGRKRVMGASLRGPGERQGRGQGKDQRPHAGYFFAGTASVFGAEHLANFLVVLSRQCAAAASAAGLQTSIFANLPSGP